MGKFTIQHTFDVNGDVFWDRIFFSQDFNRELYRERLEFKAYDILEEKKKEDGSVERKVHTEPKSEAPKVVKKVIGDSLSYTEEGTWDAKTKRYRYRIVPSKLADKIDSRGEVWVEPRGENKCERFCTVDCNVKIFGVGGAIESFIEKETKDSYDKAAQFTNEFVRREGLSGG